MTNAAIAFDVPDLAARAESASQFELDQLPFGVILLDDHGNVRFYSETEARLSGYGQLPLGQNLFALSCLGSDAFRGRIERARANGAVDLTFDFAGDYNDPNRTMHVRVQTARNGGLWLFIARAGGAQAHNPAA